MNVEYLIIGQGISGTFLSWYLEKEGKNYLVVDNPVLHSPSKIGGGIINPVTGRRYVTVWLDDEILPFAWHAYKELGEELGIVAIKQKNIIDFFPNPQMRLAFLERIEEKGPYVHSYPDQNDFNDLFNFEFGCGEIKPAYLVHLEQVIHAWRRQLVSIDRLREEEFEMDALDVGPNQLKYKNIIPEKVIFCDGINSTQNPYFRQLPFAPNKGEVLTLEIEGLPAGTIFKKGLMLTPTAEKHIYWIGSTYEWKFDHANPTPAFRQKTESLLKQWLKLPFKILDHRAGVRPATLERRPFVGLHPYYQSLGILNGMGAKGCSLAPFFAKQLVNQMVHGHILMPAAAIGRFSKVVSENLISFQIINF